MFLKNCFKLQLICAILYQSSDKRANWTTACPASETDGKRGEHFSRCQYNHLSGLGNSRVPQKGAIRNHRNL
jgi:hypothetical protein